MSTVKWSSLNENKVNLKKKTYPELQELLERQDKILSNSRFVDGLPDKGEKIKHFCAQLKEELNNRRIHEKLCKDMSLLNIGKDQLDTLEWTGKCAPNIKRNTQPNIDNDDEDVLKMFVSHSGIHQDKIIIKEKIVEPLIKPSDLIKEKPIEIENQDIESENFQNIELYAKQLCKRIDTHLKTEKCPLLLNKPAKPNIHSTVKATALSLKESVMLQYLHENKLKELQAQKSFVKFNIKNYRNTKLIEFKEESDKDSDEDSDINNED